jgi:arginine transport system substrate-binding protein
MFKKIIICVCFVMYSILGYAETTMNIKFAAEATYPPFVSMDKSGNMQGFDVDLAKALCKELAASCTFTNQPWDALIPSLKLGKFDALIGGMGITAEREKHVSFTQSYYKNTGGFVGNNTQSADVLGKKIGVQGGTTYATYLKTKYGSKVSIKTYASLEDAFLDLKAGRVELVIGDAPVLQYWIKTQGGTGYKFLEHAITNGDDKGNGIVVSKKNTELLIKLNQALDKLKKEGAYQKLVEQYFGESVS